MARRAFTTEFDVWTYRTGGDDEEGSWEQRLTTQDYDEAVAEAERLIDDLTASTISERGRFTIEGKRKTGQILFWWSENFNDSMEAEPAGRGHGWSEDYERYVNYEYPSNTALVVSAEQDLVEPEPDQPHYATGFCDRCGVETPKNLLHQIKP